MTPIPNPGKRWRRVPQTVALLLASLLTAHSAGAQQPTAPANGAPPGQQQMITLNLKDADITALISTVAEVTGRNFIVDPRVKAKVTVISQAPMPADELYRVFLSVLQVHGFSAVQSGDIVKIIPDINAKQIAVPTVTRGSETAGDEVVTRVIPVQNVAVAQLVPILRPLVPQQGHLAAYPPTNVLIISDRASNIDRMADLVRRIDQAGTEEVEVVPLEYAAAAELVRIVNSLAAQPDPNQPPGSQVKLAADERTNSVLLSGDKAARLRIRALIAQLDTPVESGGDTQVVYLRYAKAKDLVPVLTGVSKNIQQTEGARTGAAAGGQAATTSTTRGQMEISIEAHEATNSLVITAPPKVQRSLQAVIRQLDIRRAQVLVEAAIAEISESQSRQLGVSAAAMDRENSLPGFASYFSNVFGPLSNLVGTSSNGNLVVNPAGLITNGISVALGNLDSRYQFGVLIKALATSTDANILSTPSLLTMDNQEAEIRVAQNVPFVTGQYTNQGQNAVNPFNTITREDVGLILKIKPQINEGDSVLLDISQEVSNLESTTIGGNPITSKRSIKTSVLVEDGQLLALGGLIDDQIRQTSDRVPLLGDIPLLGNLFKARSTEKEKRNLLLFMQPSIIRDEATATAHTGRKYNYIRAEQLRRQERGVDLMPSQRTPVLPKLERPALPAPFDNETGT